jgi:hypothetical protein
MEKARTFPVGSRAQCQVVRPGVLPALPARLASGFAAAAPHVTGNRSFCRTPGVVALLELPSPLGPPLTTKKAWTHQVTAKYSVRRRACSFVKNGSCAKLAYIENIFDLALLIPASPYEAGSTQ